MIKKIAYLSVIGLLTLSIISCEKDFTEVGSNIIDNSKFNTKELILDVEITQQNIEAVRSGNTKTPNLYLGKYLLGIYKKPNTKTLKAGLVSQLTIPALKSPSLQTGESLSSTVLDEVILKIPVKATLKEKTTQTITNAKGETKTVKVPVFTIDSLLGNPNAEFNINVYKNGTFLTSLNPVEPSKKRIYLSNQNYVKEGSKLNTTSAISFKSIAQDTSFVFDRTLSNGKTYKDTLKIENGKTIKANPFIAIRLNKTTLQTEIFDKFINSNFTQESFNNAFKGLIIEVTGTDGALIPLDNSLKPSVDFIYTNTVLKDKKPVLKSDGSIKTIEGNHSFLFGGIRTSTYTMEGSASISNSVVLQGTAGSNALIKILNQDTNNNGLTDLEELRKKNVIVNDAQLIFDINTAVDTTNTPNRLFLYKNESDKNGTLIPTHMGDFFSDGISTLNGVLKLTNNKPDYYSFGVRKHVHDVIKGNIPNSELVLRVFNTRDFPTSATDLNIKKYNWNPRSVSLLNNSTQQGNVKGVKLKVSYTEEK